jgi:thioesterase domain-containing protein
MMRLSHLALGEARQLTREGRSVTVSMDTIRRWRREAADRRAAAAAVADPQARLGLLNAARSYDDLADSAEEFIDGAGERSDAD